MNGTVVTLRHGKSTAEVYVDWNEYGVSVSTRDQDEQGPRMRGEVFVELRGDVVLAHIFRYDGNGQHQEVAL